MTKMKYKIKIKKGYAILLPHPSFWLDFQIMGDLLAQKRVQTTEHLISVEICKISKYSLKKKKNLKKSTRIINELQRVHPKSDFIILKIIKLKHES